MFLAPPCLCTFARAIASPSLGWEPPLLPSLRKHLPYSIASTRGPRGWGHWSAWLRPPSPTEHQPAPLASQSPPEDPKATPGARTTCF